MREEEWGKARKIAELAESLAAKYSDKIPETSVRGLASAAESRNKKLFMEYLHRVLKAIDESDLYDEPETDEMLALVYELLTVLALERLK